jgi:hypothetical protein
MMIQLIMKFDELRRLEIKGTDNDTESDNLYIRRATISTTSKSELVRIFGRTFIYRRNENN